MRQISQGAEAKLFLDKGTVVKDRFRKAYRIAEIDGRLRKSRTRREAKILEKLSAVGFPTPKLVNCDGESLIKMEYIKGPTVKDILEKKNYSELCREIGKKLAILHDNDIIHGDLTTSNMILSDEIYFIDFGLSFFSKKIEDKAVDLHLLKQALESKHYKVWEKCFECVLDAYSNEGRQGKEAITRLSTVEKRGRYKGKKH